MEKILRLLPAGVSRRLARGAVPIIVGVVLLVLLAGLALAALVSPGALGISAARVAETKQLPDTFESAGLNTRDADQDGLPDALENYLYGTDASNWNSSGLGIPDGWLAQFSYDPLSPATRDARGVAPPADVLAGIPAYKDAYPREYRPTLYEYYAYGKPASYQPGIDAPWWRAGASADPLQWDEAKTGIPTGWLLHYHLDILHTNPDAVAPGSTGNLTVRDAFLHNTNPMLSDSDADGIDDWTEIHVTKTDPSKFSTAGTGIADGWLLHYGLNPFNADVASQDNDRDGLTNLEEFVYSYNTFRAEASARGLGILYEKGLDPTEWQTAHTGIPDGWYVKYGLSPFGEDVERIISNASDWREVRDLPATPAPGPRLHCTALTTNPPTPGKPIPDCAMTIKDAYLYKRPSSHNESTDGVWWGGTNPATGDTDSDGIPDAVEIRGWNANVTAGVGPGAVNKTYIAHGNPLGGDSDGDGLTDIEEYRGQTTCGATGPAAITRTFHYTDPQNRDTAGSGLTDFEKVCGVVRGDTRYDFLPASPSALTLDPTRTDSAGDYQKDGARLQFWSDRYQSYRISTAYPYEGSKYSTLSDWTRLYHRFDGLSASATIELFRPDGDVDGDGIVNVLDADPSGGLWAEKDVGKPKDTVYLPGGPKSDPTLFASIKEFQSQYPRSASDPANPDTDGDGLPDYWEIQYGRFVPSIVIGTQQGGWNLDPSRADSDNNGVTDDKENLDGDVVKWYAYDNGGLRSEHLFSFSVADEFLAHTDPNTLSTAGDDVPDGWRVFWGTRNIDSTTFPNLISRGDASVGAVALAHRDEIEAAMAARAIPLTKPLTCEIESHCKTTGYVRYACESAKPAEEDIACGTLAASDTCATLFATATLQPGESIVTTKCRNADNLNGTALLIVPIQGISTMTFADEWRLHTNPYLSDSDGDGAPDAYEAYMLAVQKERVHSASFPDPARAEADAHPDHDGDGLSLADECRGIRTSNPAPNALQCSYFKVDIAGTVGYAGAGADPNLPDSDGDGIRDLEDSSGSSSPLDPTDVDVFRDPTLDKDGDGIPDFCELTGYGAANTCVVKGVSQFSQFGFEPALKTDPTKFDTDGDGLLDGASLNLSYANATQRALMAKFNASGIAHRATSSTTVVYSGEGTLHGGCGCLPTTLDSSNTGVPDGWYAYYTIGSDDQKASLAASYNAGKPSWWDESRDGVWWWGDNPHATDVATDADGDGLNDHNGEDPFPALAANRISFAGVNVTDARDLRAFVDAGATPVEVRERAQLAGDSPGDPRAPREAFHASVARAATLIQGLHVANDTGIVFKGQNFLVTGRLVFAASGEGAANRTVLASFFSPDAKNVVGAGFTNATGNFSFLANVTSDQVVTIPTPGLTLLGATKGAVGISFNPARVSTGSLSAGVPNEVVVWAYNSSADASTPSAFTASDPVALTVRSGTDITKTISDVVDNGGVLTGDVRLLDNGGGGIEAPLKFSWTGAPNSPLTFGRLTDRTGRLNVTSLNIPVSVVTPGTYVLNVSFTSVDPNLDGSSRAFAIAVRSPTAINGSISTEGGTIGDVITVLASLRTQDVTLSDQSLVPGAPLEGALVRIALGGFATTATTDAQGNVSASFPIPGSLAAGKQAVSISFAGDTLRSGSEKTMTLSVKRTAQIVDLTTLEGPRSRETQLHGRLVDNDGQGLLGIVRAVGAKGSLGSASTDDTGAFSLRVLLDQLPLGTSTVNVTYGGDNDHGAAQNLTVARVTSATRLVLEPVGADLVRGNPLNVRARLADDTNTPVSQQAITVSWRGEKVGTVVTDETGNLTYHLETNLTERASLAELALVYAPRANSIYQGSAASARVAVLQGSTLVLDDARVTRGQVAATGHLLDDEGHPIPAAPVTLRVNGVPLGETTTYRNGSFLVTRALPDVVGLGTSKANAAYPGASGLIAGASANATWSVRSPLLLEVQGLGSLVRGETASLDATLVDDRGAPVDATLRVNVAGRDLGAVSARQGRISTTLTLPTDVPRGDAVLWINATATDKYDAVAKSLDVVVKIRPKIEIHLPAVAVRGFSVSGDIILKDDRGTPLRNTTFAYALGKGASPVIGTTDVEGRATLASVTPLSGDAAFALTIRGGPDVLNTEYHSQSVRVIGPGTPIGYASLIILVIVILVVIAAIVAIALLRRRQLGEARTIIEDAIAELLAGNEYQGVIFLAYRRFSAHTARYGYAEKESQTPREFAGSVRKALPVGALALRELIRLFEEARYSDHAIGSDERDRAVESLALVRNEIDALLGRKGPAPVPAVGA